MYGGAPSDAQPSHMLTPDEGINVPAPGAQAPKAVTQPPPWNEGAAQVDATGPNATRSQVPSPRDRFDSVEEISSSILVPEADSAMEPRAQDRGSFDPRSVKQTRDVVPGARRTPPPPPRAATGTMIGGVAALAGLPATPPPEGVLLPPPTGVM